MDVHKKGVSKGAALQKLCNMWDISLSEVIAFGNTENDVSMLKMAGISYAVKMRTNMPVRQQEAFVTLTRMME